MLERTITLVLSWLSLGPPWCPEGHLQVAVLSQDDHSSLNGGQEHRLPVSSPSQGGNEQGSSSCADRICAQHTGRQSWLIFWASFLHGACFCGAFFGKKALKMPDLRQTRWLQEAARGLRVGCKDLRVNSWGFWTPILFFLLPSEWSWSPSYLLNNHVYFTGLCRRKHWNKMGCQKHTMQGMVNSTVAGGRITVKPNFF